MSETIYLKFESEDGSKGLAKLPGDSNISKLLAEGWWQISQEEYDGQPLTGDPEHIQYLLRESRDWLAVLRSRWSPPKDSKEHALLTRLIEQIGDVLGNHRGGL